MSQRRMFSPEIVCSDAFLEMPASSRDLYFQLGMKADDDGFVNPRGIMRTAGASEDDLKILVGKRFVLPFNSGVIVIKHWKINNLVRKDWYRPTLYREEFAQLTTKENSSYTEFVNESLTVRQRRLGKDRLISNSGELHEEVETTEENTKPRAPKKYPHSKEVMSWFPNPEQSWLINTTQLKYMELLWVRGEERVKKAIKYVESNRDNPDFQYVMVKPSDYESKWNDIAEYARRTK